MAYPAERKEFDPHFLGKAQKIFGQISKKTEPYQMVLKNRLFLYSLVVILVFFIIIFGPSIWSFTQGIIKKVSSLFINNINDIIVNIIASMIYAGIVFLAVFIFNKIKSKLSR